MDIFKVAANSKVFGQMIEQSRKIIENECPNFDVIVGIDESGILLGSALALKLGKAFVPILKCECYDGYSNQLMPDSDEKDVYEIN